MDSKVQQAFEVASIVATMSSQARLLNEEYAQTLLFYYKGGTFTASEQRLAFLFSLKSSKIDSMVIVDDNNAPIMVDDIDKFYSDLLSHHKEAVNLLYYKHKKLISSKSIESILDNV